MYDMEILGGYTGITGGFKVLLGVTENPFSK